MKRNIVVPIEINAERFLNESTTVIGKTNSGKTYIVEDILYNLRNEIDQVVVFCPTDQTKGIYSRSRAVRIPEMAIMPSIKEEKLKIIWERQEALVSFWKQINSDEVIDSLYEESKNDHDNKTLDAAKNVLKSKIEELNGMGPSGVQKKSVINESFKHFSNKFKKEVIKRSKNELLDNSNRTNIEIKLLNNLELRPHLCLIFDDVTDQLKKLKSNQIIQRLFTQSRHLYITPIFAIHSDKALDTDYRRAAFNTIFADKMSPKEYVYRSTNNFEKYEKELMVRATDEIWPSSDDPSTLNTNKLLIDKEDDKYFVFDCVTHEEYKFPASKQFWDFCLQAKGSGPANTNNGFAARFAKS